MGDAESVRLSVVHRASTSAPPMRGLAPGVEALDVGALVKELNVKKRLRQQSHE
jgi:hypothetical protein